MSSNFAYVVTDGNGVITGWESQLSASLLSLSLLCCFELAILTATLWNNKSKTYFWSMAVATFCSLCYTLAVLVYFFAPASEASKWFCVLLSCIGYWIYTPAEYMVMYTRLHLLRPSRKVMLACKIMLIAEWILATTPNAVLSAAALISSKNGISYAYSFTQRIEPAIYSFVSIMLSSVYIYHAFVMFKMYRDRKIRYLLIRLLYANAFLIALGVGNVIAEYVGGGVVQSSYLGFFYSFQLKVELWMLNEIGLLASESLERSRHLRPLETESTMES